MKKVTFFLVALALLCFAMPAIASPPMGLPALEAVGPIASVASAYIVQELAPIVAVSTDSLRASQVLNFDSIAMTRATAVDVSIATAATLADFKRASVKFVARLDKAGSFANGIRRSRRWV